jgi:hypothetical protein
MTQARYQRVIQQKLNQSRGQIGLTATEGFPEQASTGSQTVAPKIQLLNGAHI